jgi:hypothetical protein
MGHEYRISIEPTTADELKNWLRSQGAHFTTFDQKERAEFRFSSSDHSKMPDATVMIEEGGVYFCYHGGDRAKVATLLFGLIDHSLADSTDSVTIRTYE